MAGPVHPCHEPDLHRTAAARLAPQPPYQRADRLVAVFLNQHADWDHGRALAPAVDLDAAVWPVRKRLLRTKGGWVHGSRPYWAKKNNSRTKDRPDFSECVTHFGQLDSWFGSATLGKRYPGLGKVILELELRGEEGAEGLEVVSKVDAEVARFRLRSGARTRKAPIMRLSPGKVANAVAWTVMGGLIIAAVMVANRLGFVGLFLLGALTWMICTLASLDQRVPTWGENVFRSAQERPRSAEGRAAVHAEYEAAISPFRFYGWCGAFLAVIGAAGFIWQAWTGPTPD